MPWPPVGLSPNCRNHWAKTMILKRKYRALCYNTAIEQGATPLLTDSLHLDITFSPPTRRSFDLDNALAAAKAGFDGISDALQVDDKHWTLSIRKGDTVGGHIFIKISDTTKEDVTPALQSEATQSGK